MPDGVARAAHLWWDIPELEEKDPGGYRFLMQSVPWLDYLSLSRPGPPGPEGGERMVVVFNGLLREAGCNSDVLNISALEKPVRSSRPAEGRTSPGHAPG